MHTHTLTQSHIHIHTHTHNTHTYSHTQHTHTHTYTHSHTHIYIYIYIYIYDIYIYIYNLYVNIYKCQLYKFHIYSLSDGVGLHKFGCHTNADLFLRILAINYVWHKNIRDDCNSNVPITNVGDTCVVVFRWNNVEILGEYNQCVRRDYVLTRVLLYNHCSLFVTVVAMVTNTIRDPTTVNLRYWMFIVSVVILIEKLRYIT